MDEVLERIKVHEFLRMAQGKLAEAKSNGRSDLVEYYVAQEHLAFLEAQCMELPMEDLDRVVKSTLADASRVLGTTHIFEEISSLVKQRDALYVEARNLQELKAQVQEEVNRLNASVRSLGGLFREVERQTHLPHREIVRCLRDFENIRAALGDLVYQEAQLGAACQQAQNDLWRLRKDIERAMADLQRLKGLRKEEFNGLANRLTSSDLGALTAAFIRKDNRAMAAALRKGL